MTANAASSRPGIEVAAPPVTALVVVACPPVVVVGLAAGRRRRRRDRLAAAGRRGGRRDVGVVVRRVARAHGDHRECDRGDAEPARRPVTKSSTSCVISLIDARSGVDRDSCPVTEPARGLDSTTEQPDITAQRCRRHDRRMAESDDGSGAPDWRDEARDLYVRYIDAFNARDEATFYGFFHLPVSIVRLPVDGADRPGEHAPPGHRCRPAVARPPGDVDAEHDRRPARPRRRRRLHAAARVRRPITTPGGPAGDGDPLGRRRALRAGARALPPRPRGWSPRDQGDGPARGRRTHRLTPRPAGSVGAVAWASISSQTSSRMRIALTATGHPA